MPVEALNAVPALARRSAQRGLEAIQAAVAAKAVQGGGGGRRFLHGVLDGDGAPGVASRRRAAAGISAVLGHPLTRPSMSELAQVISYEAYAPPPQPLPAPTEKTALPLRSAPSQAGAAAGGSTGYMANSV